MSSAPLVGMHFRPPARAILNALSASHPLYLKPEPENPYDPNAIAVWFDAETIRHSPDIQTELESSLPPMGADLEELFSRRYWHIGYMAKEHAAQHHQTIQQSIHQSALASAVEAPFGHPASLSFSGSGKYQISFDV